MSEFKFKCVQCECLFNAVNIYLSSENKNWKLYHL